MEKRLKIRILAFLSAVLLIAALFAVPASAATFPDTMLNILNVPYFLSAIKANLNNPNVSIISMSSPLGRILFRWNGEGENHISTNYLGTMRDICPSIKPGVSYTFHAEEGHDVQDFPLLAQIVIGDWEIAIANGDVFVLTEEDLNKQVFFVCYNLVPSGALHLLDHMFITPSAVPITGTVSNADYPEYFDMVAYDKSIFDQGYSAGLEQGKELGASELLDKIDKQTVSIFQASSVTVDVLVPGVDFTPEDLDDLGSYTVSNVSYTVSDNGSVGVRGILSSALTAAKAAFPNVDYTYAYYWLNFNWPLSATGVGAWTYQPILVTSGSPNALPGLLDRTARTFFGYSGKNSVSSSVKTRIHNDYRFFIEASSDLSNATITSFTLRFGDGDDVDVINSVIGWTLSSDARMTSPLYSYGYAQGFMEGQEAELGDLANSYYDDGYSKGFDAGRKEGLTISETGDWKYLVSSVVEAPVNYFQSLFNFEILGLDMRMAFGSILALCVLFIVVKKVIL